ncbi:undecaprenyl/decaprenyl-phosphate alpha-N-acetylglucosaminyl 1-phosphate transferase [Patescibacteria group bacterium]|nr:undecaprenyl/decaprenyl-phosphate alpha-N-acetylglucosaminyl 1-phosphate transferase [Patescibacteria group bacterium]MBU1721407.1 undecaprenyl/decaprenyl-phosphate alpha-N-acetylglucosaminyl 1-phosphate transferase [Patescibacteria group bacterium]MBU1901847.1 undecaprenyl/decaprenyl-phosphate alpha-N-acetylglucosaminyl 1-phosphate transferase [Patescibacteria group bacterium]
MIYLLFIVGAAIGSLLCTGVVRGIMLRLAIVDDPKKADRKIHKQLMPLGGGLAIYVSLSLFLAIAVYSGLIGTDIPISSLIGLAIGGAIIMAGGLLDDKKTLKPKQQIIFPIIAAVIAIVSGVGIESMTNPTGGILHLDMYSISINGLGQWMLLADTIVFVWLIGMMFTTKLLDGLDGLATGIVAIGASIIWIMALSPQWFQPEVALFASIFLGSCLGFLYWNFFPAKIFLGEGGSIFIGYILGSLAIISGSKIATTVLVMGIPMLDMFRVMLRRFKKKSSVFHGDSEHIHFQLLETGLSHKQAVLLLYSISFLLGFSTFFLQQIAQLIALSFLFVLMLILATWFQVHKKT